MAPAPLPDYYLCLEIPRSATHPEIKAAYRRLALLHHPDKNIGIDDATTKFQLILAAWETLSDPSRRTVYDASNPGAVGTSRSSGCPGDDGTRSNGGQERTGKGSKKPGSHEEAAEEEAARAKAARKEAARAEAARAEAARAEAARVGAVWAEAARAEAARAEAARAEVTRAEAARAEAAWAEVARAETARAEASRKEAEEAEAALVERWQAASNAWAAAYCDRQKEEDRQKLELEQLLRKHRAISAKLDEREEEAKRANEAAKARYVAAAA